MFFQIKVFSKILAKITTSVFFAATLFWGVMFGGYFGDFIDVFSKVYLHRPVTVKPVWFAPLNLSLIHI